jgi:hypothetical protein
MQGFALPFKHVEEATILSTNNGERTGSRLLLRRWLTTMNEWPKKQRAE